MVVRIADDERSTACEENLDMSLANQYAATYERNSAWFLCYLLDKLGLGRYNNIIACDLFVERIRRRSRGNKKIETI